MNQDEAGVRLEPAPQDPSAEFVLKHNVAEAVANRLQAVLAYNQTEEDVKAAEAKWRDVAEVARGASEAVNRATDAEKRAYQQLKDFYADRQRQRRIDAAFDAAASGGAPFVAPAPIVNGARECPDFPKQCRCGDRSLKERGAVQVAGNWYFKKEGEEEA